MKPSEPTGQILIYRSEDGRTKLDVRLEEQTVWLSQRQLVDLFGKAKGTISEHIKHIYADGELDVAATVRRVRTVQWEGGRDVTSEVELYNLDMVLALGFRVRSPVAMRFRQWAADKLKKYLVKGFVLDDERLKRADRSAGAGTAPPLLSTRSEKLVDKWLTEMSTQVCKHRETFRFSIDHFPSALDPCWPIVDRTRRGWVAAGEPRATLEGR